MTRSRLGVVALASLLIANATTFDARQTPARVVVTKRFTPAEQVAGRYQHVPFDVPEGTHALRIDYSYDEANGDNVVDLGLFEPGPIDLGTAAFRGYSGGARSSAEITYTTATPGYREGAIPAGRWHVLLGLYRIASGGVDVTVTVESRTRDQIKVVDPVVPTPAPVRTDQRWYLGALHTHTLHSDGTISPPALLESFRDKGFDFVAITDHNNTTHPRDLRDWDRHQRQPLRIVGEEVTTPGGHASVWGLPPGGWVDFRVMPGDPHIRDLVAAARRQGAMFSINHPASECLACGWTHEIVDGIEGIEISNGRHGEVDKAIAIWDKLLVSGRKVTGVGSSDWHSAPSPIDNAHVRVYASALTQENILAAIRAGHVIVMTDARDATPEFSVQIGETTAVIGDTLPLQSAAAVEVHVNATAAPNGRLVVVSNAHRSAPVVLDARGAVRTQLPAAPGYLRFEITRADGSALAYSNPVYLVR